MLLSCEDWAGQRWPLVQGFSSCTHSGSWRSRGCPCGINGNGNSPHLPLPQGHRFVQEESTPLTEPWMGLPVSSPAFSWFPYKEAARGTQEHLWNTANGKSWGRTHTDSRAVLRVTSGSLGFLICKTELQCKSWGQDREDALKLVALHWC